MQGLRSPTQIQLASWSTRKAELWQRPTSTPRQGPHCLCAQDSQVCGILSTKQGFLIGTHSLNCLKLVHFHRAHHQQKVRPLVKQAQLPGAPQHTLTSRRETVMAICLRLLLW